MKLLFFVGFAVHLAGCRSEHFAPADQWWLSLLDQPHRRGHNHYCVVDQGPDRPLRRGEASWIIDTDQPDRWMVLRDSVFGAVTRMVGDIPKCRDAVPDGLMRITSWPLNAYELAVITHEPAWGGLPAYEISVALGRPTGGCGDPAKAAA